MIASVQGGESGGRGDSAYERGGDAQVMLGCSGQNTIIFSLF